MNKIGKIKKFLLSAQKYEIVVIIFLILFYFIFIFQFQKSKCSKYHESLFVQMSFIWNILVELSSPAEPIDQPFPVKVVCSRMLLALPDDSD